MIKFLRKFLTSLLLFTIAFNSLTAPSASAATVGSGSCLSTVTNSGTITLIDNSSTTGYCILKFTSGTNTWTAPSGITSVDYLVVGGGGGGANGYDNAGGGGGAGGMVLAGTTTVTPGSSYSISIGSGGSGGANSRTNNPGTAGANTVFSNFTAKGGYGGFGSRTAPGGVQVGGNSQIGIYIQPAGGNGGGGGGKGGGGGGAIGSGTNGATTAGTGGTGFISTLTDSSVTYGTGGNGAPNSATTGATATANTGNGGGAGGAASSASGGGGAGGSGIVVIRFNASPKPVSGGASAPTTISLTSGAGSLSATWSAPTNTGGFTITGYQIEYSTDGTDWTISNPNQASSPYNISNLVGVTNYYVRIAARYSTGLGAYGYPWTAIYKVTQAYRNADGSITYVTNNSSTYSGSSFSRVRYLTRGTNASATAYYTDVDFDRTVFNKPTSLTTSSLDSIANLRVPATISGQQFQIQGDVSDLTVSSNVAANGSLHSAVTNGYKFTGRLELWPWNYETTPPTGISSYRGTTLQYDDADTYNAAGTYGSFQLHNISSGYKQSIFSWNRHESSAYFEIGFGSWTDSASAHPDWTFCSNSACRASYSYLNSFSLEIFANIPTSTLKASQNIYFTYQYAKTYGDSSFTISASSTNGYTITYSSTTTSICTVSGNTVTIVSAGTCTVAANQAGDTYFNAATQTTQSISINQSAQSTLTITSTTGTFGSPLTLTSSGGSGSGAVTFAVTTSGTAGCSVSGNSLSSTSAGTCTVTATKAASTNYIAVSSAATTITISSQTLSTASAPTANATTNTLKSIDVAWSAVTNATSYTVTLYSADGLSQLAIITDLLSLSTTITISNYASMADETIYKVSVTAIGTGNYLSSGESTKTSVTTNAQPDSPTISGQPSSATISSGASNTFSVTATVADSGSITYQWQVSTNSGSTWNNVASNGTSSSYTTGAVTVSSNGYQYKVIVTNSKNGATASTTSSAATLTVGTANSTITISLPGGATSATYNSAVTITASTSVNGSVNFNVGGSSISGCSSVSTTSLSATCSWTPSATGSNALTAVLTPTDTSNYTSSTSASVNVNVGTAVTTTTITVDAGQPEYLVAKNISATASVAGTVNFMFNGKTIPGCFAKATNGSLVAVCSWKPAVRTTLTITATLSPTNSAYAPSTSEPVLVTVKARTGARTS